MEIMMNNVVLMFPLTDDLTSRERIVRSYGSVGSCELDRWLINFLNVPRHGPSLKEYFNVLIVSFTSSFDQLKI